MKIKSNLGKKINENCRLIKKKAFYSSWFLRQFTAHIDKYTYIYIYLVLILLGAVIYSFLDIETSSGKKLLGFWEHVYFSITTITSLGYGDYAPKESAQIITSIQVLLGLTVFAYAISAISNRHSDRILDVLRSKDDEEKLKNKAEELKNKIPLIQSIINKNSAWLKEQPSKYGDNDLKNRVNLLSELSSIQMSLEKDFSGRIGRYRVALNSDQIESYTVLFILYGELAKTLENVRIADYSNSLNRICAIEILELLSRHCYKLEKDLNLSINKFVPASIFTSVQDYIDLAIQLLQEDKIIPLDFIYNDRSGNIKKIISNWFKESTSFEEDIVKLSENKSDLIERTKRVLSDERNPDEYMMVLGDMIEELRLGSGNQYFDIDEWVSKLVKFFRNLFK